MPVGSGLSEMPDMGDKHSNDSLSHGHALQAVVCLSKHLVFWNDLHDLHQHNIEVLSFWTSVIGP
jgi:hypothetical protein